MRKCSEPVTRQNNLIIGADSFQWGEVMHFSKNIRNALFATTAVAGLTLSPAASAQDATEAPTAGTPAGDIIVTGTRVVRDGYQAPTPLTVLTAEEIANTSPTNNSALLKPSAARRAVFSACRTSLGCCKISTRVRLAKQGISAHRQRSDGRVQRGHCGRGIGFSSAAQFAITDKKSAHLRHEVGR